jgi:hypothetical protein
VEDAEDGCPSVQMDRGMYDKLGARMKEKGGKSDYCTVFQCGNFMLT